MAVSRVAVFAFALLSLGQAASVPAFAENRMGYRLLTAQEASGLPRAGGALGMDVDRAQVMTDDNMTFDIMRVKSLRRGSAGEQSGFRVGDQIIAVDGLVFPSIATFAAYLGSVPPGRQIMIDYMPANKGPQQAERITVAMGGSGQRAEAPAKESSGMSTGTKVGIGAAAVALLGCYEFGCFSRKSSQTHSSLPQAPATANQRR